MKNLRKFMKTITCCMLSIVLCFSSSGSSFLTSEVIRVEAAETASLLDWFLTLLAAAGFSYTSKGMAETEFGEFITSLEADRNAVANASAIEELQEKIPWLNFDEENATIAALDAQLGYMYESLTSGKEAAAAQYSSVNVQRAGSYLMSKMRYWINERFPYAKTAGLGTIGQALVTVKPSPGVELTDSVAVFLSENWPAFFPVVGSARSFLSYLQQHSGEYVNDSSRFMIFMSWFTSGTLEIEIVEIPNDVLYLKLPNFDYSKDGVTFSKANGNFKSISFLLNSSEHFVFDPSAFLTLGFNSDNAVLRNNVLDDTDDGVVVLFSSLTGLFLVNSDGSSFAESDDVVKISDSISDTVPSEAVESQAIIDAVAAALEAGSATKEYDFAAVLSLISAGNDQQHEDNDKQLIKLSMIETLLSGLVKFLEENSKTTAADVGNIVVSLNKIGDKVTEAVTSFDTTEVTNTLNNINTGTLSLINSNVADIGLSIPAAIDNLRAAVDVLPIDDIAADIESIPKILGIDIANAADAASKSISADIKGLSDSVNDAIDGLGIGSIAIGVNALLERLLDKSESIDSAISSIKPVAEEMDSRGFNLLNLLHAIFMILFLLLKIFIDCLVFITLIFNIKAEPYFLNDYMVQGLEFLKTTEISGFGISIHAFLMNLLSIVVIFAVVGSLKRHIHRMKIK